MPQNHAPDLPLRGHPPEHISHAIDLSRITLIIGLVFLHYGAFPNSSTSSFEGFDPHTHPFATWLNSAVLFFFLSAVPLMSLISGWLFFAFSTESAWPTLWRRMQRRITSLYLPLVAWNLTVFASAYTLFTLRPGALNLNGINIDFATAAWPDYANAVLGVTHPPIAFQFWFVRDLLVTSLCSPLWWLLIRWVPWLGACVLGAAWLFGADLVLFFRPDIPFFFYMGALIRHKGFTVTLPLRVTVLCVALHVLLACLRPLAPLVVATGTDTAPLWLSVATNTMRIVGVAGFWGLICQLATTSLGRALASYGGLAFFLHAAHWPLLALVKTALWPLLPATTDGWMLAHYVLSVALTTGIGLTAGLILATRLPRLFALMNGGRLFVAPIQATASPLDSAVQKP
jgi:succinoglycan biosynthesis protein ExoH